MTISYQRLSYLTLCFLGSQLSLASVQAQYGNPNPYPLSNPYGPYNPLAVPNVSPYTPYNSPATAINPYLPFNPYSNLGASGGRLYGASQVLNSYGNLLNDQERARIGREQYYQAQIETQRRRFDLAMYIRAHTPTYTEELARHSKLTLQRIQNNSSPIEITNSKALNILLDDARKFPGKKIALDPIPLSADLLKNINVTTLGAQQSLGILRGDGKVKWPLALQDLLTEAQRDDLALKASNLVTKASQDRLDANMLKDLRSGVEKARDDLRKKVNEIPSQQYLEGKRFLEDFEDSLTGIERGLALTQQNFEKYVANGKSVQEVVDYMIEKGLRFAPAVQGDEAAYRALHSMLVAYDVALNSQLNGSEPRESTKE